MEYGSSSNSLASIDIENIGGIDQASETIDAGVTVLSGRNASNRTSFLQAIMAAAGSGRASLKAHASEGRVTLEIGDQKHFRELERTNGGINFEGSPYLNDSESVELFAFLLETNECREAIRRGQNLQELMLRPIDTEALEREIRQLEKERRQIDQELSRLEELERDLPRLEAKKSDIEKHIAELEAELEAAYDEFGSIEGDVEDDEEFEAELDRLNELRRKRRHLENQMAGEEESIDALESELSEATEALSNHDTVSPGSRDEIESRIDDKRTRLDRLEESINDLASLIRFNEGVLSGDESKWLTQLQDTRDAEDITVQLVSDGVTNCWTCGTEVELESIKSNQETLRSISRGIADERNVLSSEIDELTAELRDLESRERQVNQLERTVNQLETELTRRRQSYDDLAVRVEELEKEIADLEASVEESRQEQRSELLDRHSEIATIESDLVDQRDELSDVENEIDSINVDLESREASKDRREDLADRLKALRTHVEDLQREAVESFNDHMETVLDLLDYDNIERIWIERTQPEGGSSRPSDSRFELHIVRSVKGKTIYEDTVDHLSQSEREVLGLVFALAGYLVHEVYEEFPFMLLDSIEMVDSERIAKLIDYFEDYADYLVVALLEEDAAALDGDHVRFRSV